MAEKKKWDEAREKKKLEKDQKEIDEKRKKIAESIQKSKDER